MTTTQNSHFAAFAQRIDSLAWALSVGAAMIVMLLAAMGISADDVHATQPGATYTKTAPAPRTAAEIEWNMREDLKAGNNVGLPSIY